MIDLLIYVAVALAGAVVGIFIYRNNVDMFSPFADKIDTRVDELEKKLTAEIAELKKKKK